MSAALVCIDTPLSHKLLKSTGLVGGFTLLSRILGFARDLIIAGTFGANAGTDAFFVAFKIPNFLRRLFAEGAFAQAFVPVLSDYRERGDAAATRLFVAHLTGGFALILSLLTALGMIAAPALIWLFAPAFTASRSSTG
jgi:putative peptidoglycan lipid II flippase